MSKKTNTLATDIVTKEKTIILKLRAWQLKSKFDREEAINPKVTTRQPKQKEVSCLGCSTEDRRLDN